MLGKFFNSFYYGKAGKGDYTPENLPTNRVQLFFEVLRVRWSAMVRLNLLYILFWIPAIVWTFINFMAIDSVLAAQMAGEITDAAMSEQLLGYVFTWLLFMIPCIAVTGPATAGVSYISRNWARDQHSFMMSDFKDAFKENWKQALGVSCITGVLPFLVYVCYRFYGSYVSSGTVLMVVPQMLVIILGVLWLLSLQMIYTLMVTYKLSFGQLIRNAFILSVGKLPLSVGIRLITWAIPLLCLALVLLIPSIQIYVLLALILYYLIFGFSFNRLLYASFANAVCEKYINPNIEGAPVNIGLRQTTDEDYEIDPTMPQPGRNTEDEDSE